MHYIRLLKPPKLIIHGSKPSIKTLCTITTDLGDDFFPDNVDIEVVLHGDGDTAKVLARLVVKWSAGMRAVPIDLQLNIIPRSSSGFLDLRAIPSEMSEVTVQGGHLFLPTIASASSVLYFSAKTKESEERLLLRTLDIGGHRELRIWEESGDSIARHVWDAGVGLVAFLTYRQELESQMKESCNLLRRQNAGLNIIELGTGTGVTGLAMSSMISDSTVTLTDVEEAKELVERNIAANPPAPGATAQFEVLDWDNPVHQSVLDIKFDLVMASDVTYNPDSGESLVKTISSIETVSRGAIVLVSMKERHPSERVFFERMNEAGFTIVEGFDLLASSQADHYDRYHVDKVYVRAFRRH